MTRSFDIKPKKTTLTGLDDFLLYNVRFSPMKPFKTSLDLCIYKESGGLWKYYFFYAYKIFNYKKLKIIKRFKIYLEATEPDEDDVITIHSALNRTSSVSFRLENKYKDH